MSHNYINLSTLQFPVYQGDIRLEHPDMGEQFVLPEGYAEVDIPLVPTMPDYSPNTQLCILSSPFQQDGQWKCEWNIRDMTEEEIKNYEDFVKVREGTSDDDSDQPYNP